MEFRLQTAKIDVTKSNIVRSLLWLEDKWHGAPLDVMSWCLKEALTLLSLNALKILHVNTHWKYIEQTLNLSTNIHVTLEARPSLPLGNKIHLLYSIFTPRLPYNFTFPHENHQSALYLLNHVNEELLCVKESNKGFKMSNVTGGGGN